MQSVVEGVIYFYVFVCVALMIFNILYIARSSWVARRKEREMRYWREEIENGCGSFVLSDRQLRKLQNVETFASFQGAVISWVLGTAESDTFFHNNAHQLQELAVYYGRRDAMERAFMASLIASTRCADLPNAHQLAEIMLSYLEDSTVYCRENVLQALYTLGRPNAVEHALHIMNENEWYHSPKLLSDGMTMYLGDKEELALILWENRHEWAETYNVATVLFASFLESPTISEEFEEALLYEPVTAEVRFALIRYFGYCPSVRMHERLVRYVEGNDQFAVVAASALSSYPGDKTKQVLMKALRSRNWHVRHNAARSLSKLGLTEEERREVVSWGDRYASEMLDYVLGPLDRGGAS
ncbi:MAG: HEAT repeat domain-containing protein [Coriobacteriales bacterium]|nr:HEAT repeat domain-containing protein [Coriobacteriales bacterium]